MAGKNRISGGHFQDSEGVPLANGYITMELCTDAQATSGPSQVVGGLVLKINLDNNGNVADTIHVWPNDTLNPPNSCYLVDAFKQDGTRAWKTPQYQSVLSTPSPYDISVWVPTANGGCSGCSGDGCQILLQTDGANNTDQCALNLKTGANVTLTPDGAGGVTIASSASGSGILLQTDGVDNGDQAKLNLISGSGIDVSDGGSGNVTIAATPPNEPFTVNPAWWTSGDGSPFVYSPGAGQSGKFGTGTANEVKFWMIRIPYTIRVSKMSTALAATEASALVGYGVYSSDGTTKLLSWDSMDVSVSGTFGAKNTTISPVTLVAGVYIVAMSNSNAANTATTGGSYTTRGSSNGGDPWNNNGTIRAGVGANPSIAGVMPSSLGALSTSNALQDNLALILMEP